MLPSWHQLALYFLQLLLRLPETVVGQLGFLAVSTSAARYTGNWIDGWRWLVLWESTCGAVPVYQSILPL